MEGVSVSELLAAFGSDSEASVLARTALLSGAEFFVGPRPLPASMLQGILRGRVGHMRRRGREVVGAERCLADLGGMGERGLHVGWVDDRKETGYVFRIYLVPHPLHVIACIGVDNSTGDGHVSSSAPQK